MSEACKFDEGKIRLDLLPVSAFEEIGKVLTVGATKYGERNWEKGMEWSRVYAATLRHLFAWWKGEEHDKEDGISHLSHAACNLVFLIEYARTGIGEDNRPYMSERREVSHNDGTPRHA